MRQQLWLLSLYLVIVSSPIFADETGHPASPNQETSAPLVPNANVTVNGKSLPTRLWALVNGDPFKQNSVDWEYLKNGTLRYENPTPRVLKITFAFKKPVNNMYMMFLSAYAGCIGSYVLSPKDYQAFALGMETALHADHPGSENSLSFDFYIAGINPNDKVGELGGNETIKWLAGPDKPDMANAKTVSTNMSKVCPDTINPSYINNAWVELNKNQSPPGILSLLVRDSDKSPKIATPITPLERNTFVTINGRNLPTRLGALANEEAFKDSSDWDNAKNGMLSYEPLSPRGVKIKFSFDKPISRKFEIQVAGFAGCIGSYMAPLKDYEAVVSGVPKYLPPDHGRSDDGIRETWYSMGINSSDDINAIIANEPISWTNLNGPLDMDAVMEVSANKAQDCMTTMNPAYVDQERVALARKFAALPKICPNGTVRQFDTVGDRDKEIATVSDWIRANQIVIRDTGNDIQTITLTTTFGSPRRPFRYMFQVSGNRQSLYAVVNADRLCDKPRFSLMCTTKKGFLADPSLSSCVSNGN